MAGPAGRRAVRRVTGIWEATMAAAAIVNRVAYAVAQTAAASVPGALAGLPKTCPPAGEVMADLHPPVLTVDGGGTLVPELDPDLVLVERPALIEEPEPGIDGRFWIRVADGDELDVQGEPGVEADLVARFREPELLGDRGGQGVLVAEPHLFRVVSEGRCLFHEGEDLALEPGLQRGDLEEVVRLQCVGDRCPRRPAAYRGHEPI